MKSREMAEDYAYRARRCLREAELAYSEQDYPGVVRRAQESIELAAKVLLRLHGIEYPRVYDVGDALKRLKNKVSKELAINLPDIIELLSNLSKLRGPAFYGYEREGIPARRAFSKEFAEETLRKVEKLVSLCLREIK